MGQPADIDFLVGRKYVTKSGKACVLRKLGNGALRADWKSLIPDAQADRDEVNAWVVALLEAKEPVKIDLEVCEDESKEAEMYAAWKKELQGDA